MSTQPSALSYADRDLRQREIIPPQELAGCQAVVIGVGAIGRQVALQLAAVGLSTMDLVDPDTVGIENLASQGYWQSDVGLAKVHATAEVCHRIHPAGVIRQHPRRFGRASPKGLAVFHEPCSCVVFCCVDSIATRSLIWEAVRPKAALFVDGRMSAEVIRVLACQDCPNDPHYASTLFAPEQAYAGSCTSKSTIYTASIAAGLMLSQFTRWLRGLPIDRDLSLNLLASELCCADPSSADLSNAELSGAELSGAPRDHP